MTRHLGFFLRGLIAIIRLYQRTLSPDTGWFRGFFPAGVCRYVPTCSQYMVDALRQVGWPGIILGLKRISRCHPWAAGGHDPVINKVSPT